MLWIFDFSEQNSAIFCSFRAGVGLGVDSFHHSHQDVESLVNSDLGCSLSTHIVHCGPELQGLTTSDGVCQCQGKHL